MKSKLEVIMRLLKANQISVEEAALLLEGPVYTPNYPTQPVMPIADWTYRPGFITYSGTDTTAKISRPPSEYGC